ncbi:MAG: YjbF family lipoprotein [Pseudomonadota bacterium]
MAMTTLPRALAALGLCLAVSGCADGLTDPPEALKPLAERLGLYTEPSRFEASRAEIAATGIDAPLLRVVAREPVAQSAGYLLAQTTGGLDTYTANDGSLLFLRSGLLQGTIGFRQDLDGASVAPVAAALDGGAARYDRLLRHRAGDGPLYERMVACTLTPEGAEQIVILGRRHATTRHVERCVAPAIDPAGRRLAFENLYWTEAGRLRASEQWVSEGVGRLRIEQVLP